LDIVFSFCSGSGNGVEGGRHREGQKRPPPPRRPEERPPLERREPELELELRRLEERLL
jgi:hypothetical protein